MKTIKHLSFALMLASLLFTACKKEEQRYPIIDSNPGLSSKITKQLLNFRNNLKMKSGGELPDDSAVWYLEGLLNYEHANNNHQISGLELFHDTLVLYSSGNSLSFAELNQAYAYFTSKLNAYTLMRNNPDFVYDAVDIAISTSGLKNGATTLTMTAGGGLNTVGIYIAFGPTDYWVWGMQGGKCGPYAGQGGLSDAAQELNYRFTHPWAVNNGYFTNLAPVYADGSEFPDPANPGPYCDTKIFYFNAGNSGIWPCLGPVELNYYLAKMPEIIQAKNPEGKRFACADADAILIPNSTNIYWHRYTLYYGDFTIYNPNN
jgi:hypothetical protein